MKPIFLALLLFCTIPIMAQIKWPSITELDETYEKYYEVKLDRKVFGIEKLQPLLLEVAQSNDLSMNLIGRSVENRPIYGLSYGHGPIKVLFWSQMHGDESTATMALIDFFHWLTDMAPDQKDLRQFIQDEFHLYFIPMLNPDGAEKFQRRNSLQIDLNRDALELTSPEAQLLKNTRDSLQPHFGFNLHDQSVYYRAGETGDQVALGFLAPAFNENKDINGVRFRAMQIIANLYDSLHHHLPQKIAKYDDTFEPRAFGDNIQKWGTSTILIESGGISGDPEKQFLRKMNYFTFIKSLESIANKTYETKILQEYQRIPYNQMRMLSFRLNHLSFEWQNQKFTTSIGWRESSSPWARIQDIGDLSTYSALEEFNAHGYQLKENILCPNRYQSFKQFFESNWQEQVAQGYLHFMIDEKLPKALPKGPISFFNSEDIALRESTFQPYQINQNPKIVLNKGQQWTWIYQGRVWTMKEITADLLERFKK